MHQLLYCRVFYPKLQRCGTDFHRIANLMMDEGSKMNRIYAGYGQGKQQSEALIVEHRAFFDELQKKLKDTESLSSYLLRPIQRITKYPLLLKVHTVHSTHICTVRVCVCCSWHIPLHISSHITGCHKVLTTNRGGHHPIAGESEDHVHHPQEDKRHCTPQCPWGLQWTVRWAGIPPSPGTTACHRGKGSPQCGEREAALSVRKDHLSVQAAAERKWAILLFLQAEDCSDCKK